MKLTLNFSLPLIGLVKIVTNSETGTCDKLFVSGDDKTEDGEMETRVAEAIGRERWLFAMFDAQNSADGVFHSKEKAS